MKMEKRVFADIDALSRAALDEVFRITKEAVAKHGRCAISLSGGHTPERMFAMWSQDAYRSAFPWERVHFFWGDDRYVPYTDPLSNFGVAKKMLFDKLTANAHLNLHRMPTENPDPREAAKAYAAEMRKFFGTESPAFDVQLLGLGGEGHTASLFPDNLALNEEEAWVLPVTVPATPPHRLTMTYPVINQARNTYFLVAGESKREILKALAAEPDAGVSRYPAARVRPAGPLVWMLDQAAAA
ncbi:MAG TPA: 6-phosphogluconolactonase [Candidatus Acidoferrales bacterium]|nr:6-phosphogluconolactonase [Candidatus Acidoferrales bacterium]